MPITCWASSCNDGRQPEPWRCPPTAMNPRAAAARILSRVCDAGRSLSPELAGVKVNPADRALLAEMCYGSLRHYFSLSALLQDLLEKPLKTKDGDVRALLLVGLYQLSEMRVPEHAAVSETVAATQALKKPWARGLVNAVLRNFVRRRDALLEAHRDAEPVRWQHPQWLIDRLRRAWPDHWQAILTANNQRPPMTLRVNQARISPPAYTDLLQQAGLQASAHERIAGAITLQQPVDVQDLPGFSQGLVSVQDAGAQLAAPWLDLLPGQRVLDVCAAPGGKAGHILESAAVELVAVDIDPQRLARVQENLDRLTLQATLLAGDASRPQDWWDGQGFDRILLDAPCSATGVIRRHPDIKVLRRETDIETLAALQHNILGRLWPLLKPGGILLYATCSVLPEENEQQIAAFVAVTPDARIRSIQPDLGIVLAHGVQLLPGMNGQDMAHCTTDGFYYACLERVD